MKNAVCNTYYDKRNVLHIIIPIKKGDRYVQVHYSVCENENINWKKELKKAKKLKIKPTPMPTSGRTIKDAR
jgi:hypothetical protein